jgi:thioredoxin reductase
MFFLHALATKRKKLEEEGDLQGLSKLPFVTVFEKSASPGGVWRSDRSYTNAGPVPDPHESKEDAVEVAEAKSTNMYEGLWTNGHKDGIEFFDYTFDDHFQAPLPVYLPREHVLEYMMARVTKHEDIFQHVQFNTTVQSVSYDDDIAQFVITTNKNGISNTSTFDKCIWASGLNGKPKMVEEIQNKLSNFQGQIVHSSEMDKLSSDDNAVKGKRILMIGDSFSAEDLALSCIKLGAEKIYISSRKSEGSASYMGSWPEDKVTNLFYSQVSGVKDDGIHRTIVFDALEEDGHIEDAEDVSIVIFCTGYGANLDFVEEKLLPWTDDDVGVWSMDDTGRGQKDWKMKDNALTDSLGHVDPSEALPGNAYYVNARINRRLLISNPNMMYLHEHGEYPLLDIDIGAWLCLAYITGEKEIPTKEQMLEVNRLDLLNSMHEMGIRYDIDENYMEAWDALPDDHWINDTLSSEYRAYYLEDSSYAVRIIARDMVDASYPLQFGNIDELNEAGEKLLYMMCRSSFGRFDLEKCDEDTKRWKTFRDMDPSPYSSLITGTKSVPLKGKWLEIDDEGNLTKY